MRRRSTLPFLLLCIVGSVTYFFYSSRPIRYPGSPVYRGPPAAAAPEPPRTEPDFPSESLPPLPTLTLDSHPIHQLIENATTEFQYILHQQSNTLAQAVAEYKRRYGIPPPPNFDKWFQFAQKKGVVLIDEYDSILDTLKPFWAVQPSVIRARAREALGFDNFLVDVLIRDGAVSSAVDGWQQESTVGMIKTFVQWLPDMDLAFNTHDEPRVVVPQDDLRRLVQAANEKINDLVQAKPTYKAAWSSRPADMDYTKRVPECRTTRFNRFAHQATWTSSRLSCPPESPARSLSDNPKDDTKAYTHSELSLIQNKTAFSDICNSPSFRQTYGFFDRPNSFDIVHDLFPIFSQSKISSFQDILYPSPWYWDGKVPYKSSEDISWDQKQNKLYWRGSTTGGFSRDDGWRRQHRQQVVRNVNAKNQVRVLERAGADQKSWHLTQQPRTLHADLFDVRFSHIGQCDPGDCQAQESFFTLAPQAAQEAAWHYKYLLDVDGNAFSGRFYAFLQSRSAVFKMAVFREWHDGDGWIRPWVHYIPLTLNGHEYVEVMRYFDREKEGQVLVKQMAEDSQQWAQKALRNEDLEVWFFRLLLEYGRLVDDDRDNIGFTMPSGS